MNYKLFTHDWVHTWYIGIIAMDNTLKSEKKNCNMYY